MPQLSFVDGNFGIDGGATGGYPEILMSVPSDLDVQGTVELKNIPYTCDSSAQAWAASMLANGYMGVVTISDTDLSC